MRSVCQGYRVQYTLRFGVQTNMINLVPGSLPAGHRSDSDISHSHVDSRWPLRSRVHSLLQLLQQQQISRSHGRPGDVLKTWNSRQLASPSTLHSYTVILQIVVVMFIGTRYKRGMSIDSLVSLSLPLSNSSAMSMTKHAA